MPALLELRWEFTPKALFEDRLVCEFSECQITVDDGVVIALLPLLLGQVDVKLRKAVEEYVELLFLGVQIEGHAHFQLGRPNVSTLHDDGSRGHIIECETGTICFRGGRPDIRYTRSDGTVVDTRRDRIDRKHRLSHAAAAFGPGDQALSRMLRSYRSAIADETDELIHLYEVLDTLTTTFGSQTEALRRLGQPKRNWSRLGKLCNDLPLRQGRHRGRIGEELRAASEEELNEARSLSAGFIESYINYLESNR